MERPSRKRKRNRVVEEDVSDRKKSKQDPSVDKDSSTSSMVKHKPAPPAAEAPQPEEGGQVLVMGQGDVGQLGLGEDMVERKRPYPVKGLEGHQVVEVVCGGMHTAALTDKGKVFTWGCNDESALGRTVKEDGEEFVPGLVGALENHGVVQLSAGDSHTAALLDNGDVYAWGVFRDSNGPFGLVEPLVPVSVPTCILTGEGQKIASGSDHIVILTRTQDILTLGCGEQGQLGRVCEIFSHRGGRKGIAMMITPKLVRFHKPKPKFVDIFCGTYDTFALTSDGAVYAWGLNNYGQLGIGNSNNQFQPKRLSTKWEGEGTDGGKSSSSALGNCSDLSMAGGLHHTVVCSQGSLFVMGRTEYGRLGLGTDVTEEVLTPRKVPGISGIKQVATGSACSFAVGSDGGVFSWGMGTNLQLGTGEEEEDIWTPTKVRGKNLEGKIVLSAALGGQHTALLVSSASSSQQ